MGICCPLLIPAITADRCELSRLCVLVGLVSVMLTRVQSSPEAVLGPVCQSPPPLLHSCDTSRYKSCLERCFDHMPLCNFVLASYTRLWVRFCCIPHRWGGKWNPLLVLIHLLIWLKSDVFLKKNNLNLRCFWRKTAPWDYHTTAKTILDYSIFIFIAFLSPFPTYPYFRCHEELKWYMCW